MTSRKSPGEGEIDVWQLETIITRVLKSQSHVVYVLTATLLTQCSSAGASPSGRPWTVDDSVAVRYYLADQDLYSASGLGLSQGTPIVFAPDKQHFFFVYRAGELSSDSEIFTLEVFSVREVLSALKRRGVGKALPPLRTIAFKSGRSDILGPAMSGARWDNNGSILFLGVKDEGYRTLFRLNVATGSLDRFKCDEGDALDPSSSSTTNNSVIFESMGAPKPWAPLEKYPIVAISGSEMGELYRSNEFTNRALCISYRGGSAVKIGQINHLYGAWISPNGRLAVAVFTPLDDPYPTDWHGYELNAKSEYNRFMLIDLQNGSMHAALGAPIGTATTVGTVASQNDVVPDAFWSTDGSHVVMTNTALPISADSSLRRTMSYVVDYTPTTGRWNVIEPLRSESGQTVSRIDRVPGRDTFRIFHKDAKGNEAKPSSYSLQGDFWRSTDFGEASTRKVSRRRMGEAGLRVWVQETANDPPVVRAAIGRVQIDLTAQDPALVGISRASVQQVSWIENSGSRIYGGLMLPDKPASSKPPFPLVIQAYMYQPHLFRPDGFSHSAYAAQALVAKGIAVLSIDIPDMESYKLTGKPSAMSNSPQEGSAFVMRIDAAVRCLVASGLVDETRVGLVGWSRGGYLTYYAITHPGKTLLAAAIANDFFTGSYGEYVEMAAMDSGSSILSLFDRLYGAGTFWTDKANWMNAPGFNVDKVKTPTLFINGPSDKINALEIIGAFRVNNRPFDYFYMPRAAHQPIRPRERQSEMQATVDWMSFWLLGSTELGVDDGRLKRWQSISDRWSSE